MAFFVRSMGLRPVLLNNFLQDGSEPVLALGRVGDPSYFPTKKLYHSIDRRINLACNPTSLSWM